MREIPREETDPNPDDAKVLENLPNKYVMAPVHALTSLVMRRTRTYFEEGTKDELADHEANGGTLQILMTHFRRWEPIVMAQVAWRNKALGNLPYNTGITARSELFDIPGGVGFVVRNSGAVRVKRPLENLNETPDEKAARKDENQATQAVGGRFLANNGHWLIFPEGGSKVVVRDEETGEPVKKNGKVVRKEREPGVVLPAQMGFVHSLKAMTPEEREHVKLLGIAVHYGDQGSSSFRATVAIPRLVSPLEGDYEDKAHQELVRQQGEDLLRRGTADAVRLHNLRR